MSGIIGIRERIGDQTWMSHIPATLPPREPQKLQFYYTIISRDASRRYCLSISVNIFFINKNHRKKSRCFHFFFYNHLRLIQTAKIQHRKTITSVLRVNLEYKMKTDYQ